MSSGLALQLRVVIARKSEQLPRYFTIPAELLADQSQTFVVLCSINGGEPFRRSLKPWGDGMRWFIELTEPHCRQHGVDTGSTIEVSLTEAQQIPGALSQAIESEHLESTWAALSPSDRRALAEHVFDARREATATKRIMRIIAKLRSQEC